MPGISSAPQMSPGEELGRLAREIGTRYGGTAAPCFEAHDGRYVFIQDAPDLGVVHVRIDSLSANLVVLDGGVVRSLHDKEREPLRTDKIDEISDPATTEEVLAALEYLSQIP